MIINRLIVFLIKLVILLDPQNRKSLTFLLTYLFNVTFHLYFGFRLKVRARNGFNIKSNLHI